MSTARELAQEARQYLRNPFEAERSGFDPEDLIRRMADHLEAPDAIVDPFQYIGRVTRDADGKVRRLSVFYGNETFRIEDGAEFVTFTTVVDLEDATPPDAESDTDAT